MPFKKNHEAYQTICQISIPILFTAHGTPLNYPFATTEDIQNRYTDWVPDLKLWLHSTTTRKQIMLRGYTELPTLSPIGLNSRKNKLT